MEKMSILAASLFMIGGISWFFFGKKNKGSSEEDISSEKEKIELNISGMHCAGCAAGIEGTLRGIDGIVNVSVNFATSKGIVEYNPEKVSKEDIINKIKELGYDASFDINSIEKKS